MEVWRRWGVYRKFGPGLCNRWQVLEVIKRRKVIGEWLVFWRNGTKHVADKQRIFKSVVGLSNGIIRVGIKRGFLWKCFWG